MSPRTRRGHLDAPDATLVERALCRLGRVRSLEKLGTRGPLQAAVGPGSLFANALFGRDTAIMALDLLPGFPAVGRATIEALTSYQGAAWRARSEEQPGRVLHEHRPTEQGRYPYWEYPYYGSVDATPLFVRLVGDYVERYGPGILGVVVQGRQSEQPITVMQGVERAVAWIEQRLERLPFLWVQRAQPHGIANQIWPDSWDALWYEDGRLLDPDLPYAPIGVQGLAYDALLIGADLTVDAAQAARWRERAGRLRQDVVRDFWHAKEGTFLLALVYDHGDTSPPTPLRVVGSDPGHLLDSRLLDGDDLADHRARLAERLCQPDLLAAAGLRIKSVGGARFNPGSYHNGSVWPMDTGRIADGLRRHGFTDQAEDLEQRLLRACAQHGLVEFFRGDPLDEIRINQQLIQVGEHTPEQPPQATQGWTVSRVWKLLYQRGLVCSSES